MRARLYSVVGPKNARHLSFPKHSASDVQAPFGSYGQ